VARSGTFRLALAAVGLLALAACQPGLATSSPSVGPTPTVSPEATGPAAQLPPQDPIAGVVTNVESSGLDSVTAFTLRAVDGQTYRFVVGRLENAAQFPPGHLVEHAANSEPIRVTWLALGASIIATRIEDANPSASAAEAASPVTTAPPIATTLPARTTSPLPTASPRPLATPRPTPSARPTASPQPTAPPEGTPGPS